MLRSSSISTNAATFSPMIQVGRHSWITRNMCGQRSRSSARPFLCPACEKGWHGNPPVRMSTVPQPPPSNVLMSSCITARGQCLCSTACANGSISQKVWSTCSQTISVASAKPPMPEKRSRCRISYVLRIATGAHVHFDAAFGDDDLAVFVLPTELARENRCVSECAALVVVIHMRTVYS